MQARNEHDLSFQVLKTILYFDIFSYPLTDREIFGFLGVKEDFERVARCIPKLVEERRLFRFGNLYCINDENKKASRRLKGNAEAEKWLAPARDQAYFIGRFPFVRGVMASGSLSKGYMDEKSDLDFFIVTAPGRLWIARTILVMYKRLFLANNHKRFCVNYFVDADHLEIAEKNVYTAIEMATLIPLYNQDVYHSLLRCNAWIQKFQPNFRPAMSEKAPAKSTSLLKNVLEFLIQPFANLLDPLFMKISLARWRRVYASKYQEDDFNLAFKTARHVSKNHPNNYQKKILDRFERKLADYKTSLIPVNYD